MKKFASLAFLLPALACSPAPTAEGPVAAAAPASPYAFDVALTLTPRAAEKLVSTKERVIVAGMFWGAPNAAAKSTADEMGQIPLGEDLVEVAPENATITVPAASFDPAQLPNVEGAPQVLVNVYSARKTHEDNLLSCGIYEGPVAMAQKQAVDIRCDLIYDENGEPLPAAPSPT
ncbi:MAG: hypothetical protein K9G83_11205 [Hyphomonadaceae bacterium]|jgi:hypothetical protein|nr:hypothetical protein [Hyphomonadaceae bacterium]